MFRLSLIDLCFVPKLWYECHLIHYPNALNQMRHDLQMQKKQLNYTTKKFDPPDVYLSS